MSKSDPVPSGHPPPALRLARFRVDHPVVGVGPPFHNLSLVDCNAPDGRIEGWSIAIRGGAVFFLSPRGWTPNRSVRECDGKGRVTIVEIPRQHITFVWECDSVDAIDKLQRLDVPALKREQPVVAPQPALDSKEMGDP